MKKKMKRLMSGILAGLLSFSITACGSSEKTATTDTEITTSKEGNATEETTENNKEKDSGLSGYTATELAVILGNGFNLGNTMEAADMTRPGDYAKNQPAHFETLWGQPITTKE
ncbi:MAG: hypothetical protein IKQ49_10630 [Eubacterium sp.]|nr:hypothetical protein [Eubacterium sp.]